MKTVQIHIRNVPGDIALRLSNLAKAAGKSRERYLLDELTLMALHPELKEIVRDYTKILDTTTRVIEENTRILQQMLEEV